MALPEHHCELSVSETDLQGQEGFLIFCAEKLRAWTTINKKHPRCSLFAISSAATENERKRHIHSAHWWIIHPYSLSRFAWENFMLIVYLFSFITIPFMICFIVQDYKEILFDDINCGLYIIFWIDIIGNCFTGFYYKKEKEVTLHQGKILLNYLKGYLLIDIFSSLPYDRITRPWRKLPGPDSSFLIDLINFLPMLKLLRYFTFNIYTFQIFTYYNIEQFTYQMFTTLSFFFFVIYWATCLCYVIPVLVMKALRVSIQGFWLAEIEEYGILGKFRASLFIVLENLTASGFGLIEPKSEGHLMVMTILMIIGRLFESYIVVLILQIRNEKKAAESKYVEIINQVSAYATQKQLPIHMRKRILAYYHYRFQNSFFREKEILSKLTDELREEITLHSCRRLVENVAIFHNLPKNILTSVVAVLKPELYLVNDVIVKAGTHGDCMFFLASGTAVVLTPTGKEVCHLEDGSHFGEVALLVQDQKRVASVVAIDVCEVYRLERTDFRKLIAVHSDLFAKIERIAAERIERTMLIEEQHKRFLMESSRVPSTSKKRKSKIR